MHIFILNQVIFRMDCGAFHFEVNPHYQYGLCLMILPSECGSCDIQVMLSRVIQTLIYYLINLIHAALNEPIRTHITLKNTLRAWCHSYDSIE